MSLAPEHLDELADAKRLLENPGFPMKLANYVGLPVEKAVQSLPREWSTKVARATQDALRLALDTALFTLRVQSRNEYPWWHKAGAMATGAAGGAFGISALAIELPVSTIIMCRSIADIARANGENLATAEARLACLQVFALGGTSNRDDAANAGYFGVRASLAHAVSEAVEYLASQTVSEASAPALVRLVALVASRFQMQVSQKLAAQIVPVIGAAGGALINLVFIDHFQEMSRGHFTIRRLERHYAASEVQVAYEQLPPAGAQEARQLRRSIPGRRGSPPEPRSFDH